MTRLWLSAPHKHAFCCWTCLPPCLRLGPFLICVTIVGLMCTVCLKMCVCDGCLGTSLIGTSFLFGNDPSKAHKVWMSKHYQLISLDTVTRNHCDFWYSVLFKGAICSQLGVPQETDLKTNDQNRRNRSRDIPAQERVKLLGPFIQ